jgi:hypothetical protein
MKTIFKYPLRITDMQPVMMPMGARPLAVQFQGETLCLWAEVDDSRKLRQSRFVYIVGTGRPRDDLPGDARHIATVQHPTEDFVWHVYVEPER